MSHCWKSHVAAHLWLFHFIVSRAILIVTSASVPSICNVIIGLAEIIIFCRDNVLHLMKRYREVVCKVYNGRLLFLRLLMYITS